MLSLNYYVFLSLKVVFIIANSADPGEMQLCCISYGSPLFANVPVQGFRVYKRVKLP